jgi:tetratricopeptide (TPR) repeat protein
LAIASSWWSIEAAQHKSDELKIQANEIVTLKTASEYLESGRHFYDHHLPLEAIKEYQKAIDADPKNAMAYHLMAYSLFLTKQNDKARLAIEKAIEFSPDGPWIRYNASLIYWASNEKAKTVEQIQNLKRIEDKNKSDRMIKILKSDGQFREIKKLPEVVATIGQ